MKIVDARLRMTRKHLAAMHAAVLMFALVATTIPFPVIAEDAPPPPSVPEETVTETEPTEPEAPAETPDVPDGLTDNTKPPVAPDEPEAPDVPESPEVPETPEAPDTPELPETPEETPPPADDETPEEPQAMMRLMVVDDPSEGQCVIVSDETTLEGGDDSVLLTYIHTAWTAMVSGASWIWGDEPATTDPSAAAESQTFTKTFSLEGAVGDATLEIAADNSYTVVLNGEEVWADAGEFNYTSAGKDTIPLSADDFNVGLNTLTITVDNHAQSGGTWATNPAGLRYKLTIDGTDCGEPEEPETATIVAHKIVCPDESELPNWGAGSDNITESTAEDFLEEHPSCYLAPDWEFEWVTDEDSNTNPGDNSGVAGTPWSLFGPTDGDGMVTAEVPAGGKIWVREILKNGFIPFTGQNTDQSVSAEIYCSTDVLNYDNWDWIDPVEAGETYHCVAFNAPATATVKMCKTDTEEEGLPGWQLTLTGEEVDSIEVVPDGDDYTIEDVPAGDYVVTASGQYIYRPGDAAASTSDAAYSLRLPSDSVYGGPFVPWVRVNDFPLPYTGWLGIMLNGAVTDWGSVFNPAHVYQHGTSTGSISDFVFTILDDVYGDNSGNLTVDLHKGYTGVTGEDGCVTFENVPYGTYEADEILQEGWTMVSGTGTVVVDEPTETFTIVNTDEELPPENSAYIVAAKVVCDSEEYLPNNLVSKPITVALAQDWVAQSQGKCHLESGWEFEWGNQNAGDGGPATIGHAPNYTIFGPTDVNGVASTYVPLDGITTIQMREVLKEGYIPFTNSGDNVSAEFYCANDAVGYDNWEWITNPQAGATYHCVAFNALAEPIDDGLSSITIVKESVGGTGTFTVNVKDATPLAPESFDWGAVITTTVAGVASSTMQFAPPDTYTIEEIVPEGWDLTSVSCTGEEATTNPLTITVSEGEDVTCTLVNTKEPEPTTLQVHIYKYLLTEGIAQIANGSGAPDFPMFASWDAANLGAGSGNYVLGNFHGGTSLEYAADTSPMQAPADYTTSEVTDGSVVVGHDQQCVADKYRLVGYKWGETLEDAEATTTISTTAPVFTDIETDRYVIVVNEDCDDVIEEEGPEPTAETIVVSPSNMNGWAFFPENTNSGQTGQMILGPLLAPLGLGSAQFVLTADNQGEVLGTAQFAGTRLDDIVSLVYHTYRASGGAAVAPALQFEFDNDVTDLDNNWRGRLVYEPYHTQTVTTGVWETWDALDDAAGTGTGNWWGSGNALSTLDEVCPQANPCTWSEILAAFPNAGVRNDGPLTGLTLFKAGSGWTGGFDGNVDQFVIRIDNGTTDHMRTFDFEPSSQEEPTEGRLIVNKVVVNDDEGGSVAGDFSFTVNGGSSIQFESDGTNELLLAPGTYTVSENDPAGYDASHSNCTDIEVVAGETVTCTITNDDEEEGGGGGGGGGGGFATPLRRGSVLGATTDTMCTALLSTFMRMGITNDTTEVLELQGFLNEHMAAGLPLTGVFGPLTDAAVHVFQKKYWEDVLKPWFPYPDAGIADADDSTGYVYKTTQWKINDIVCPGVAPFPALP